MYTGLCLASISNTTTNTTGHSTVIAVQLVMEGRLPLQTLISKIDHWTFCATLAQQPVASAHRNIDCGSEMTNNFQRRKPSFPIVITHWLLMSQTDHLMKIWGYHQKMQTYIKHACLAVVDMACIINWNFQKNYNRSIITQRHWAKITLIELVWPLSKLQQPSWPWKFMCLESRTIHVLKYAWPPDQPYNQIISIQVFFSWQ